MRWFGLVLILLTSPAVAADQFDLLCTAVKHRKTYQVHYRVDLAKKLFCVDDCSIVLSIAAVNEARITFQQPDQDSSLAIIHYVDRGDGRWVDFLSGVEDLEGKCEPAPFSGIPQRKF